jgi:hypothetical protein
VVGVEGAVVVGVGDEGEVDDELGGCEVELDPLCRPANLPDPQAARIAGSASNKLMVTSEVTECCRKGFGRSLVAGGTGRDATPPVHAGGGSTLV